MNDWTKMSLWMNKWIRNKRKLINVGMKEGIKESSWINEWINKK